MKKIIAKINFKAGDKEYIKGDEIDLKNINSIRKLNEQGFIEPLTYEDLILIERSLNKKEVKHEL